MKILKIGTPLFLVNKSWKKYSIIGGRVIPGKLAGYQNIDGKVNYIIKVGNKEYDPTANHVFTDLEKAVEAIK